MRIASGLKCWTMVGGLFLFPLERSIVILLRGEKTKAVRDYLADHPEASPAEIVAELAQRGMTIKLTLANGIKYGKRRKKKRHGRPSAVAVAVAVAPNGVAPGITLDQLIEVKKLSDSVGGAAQVRQALDALALLR